MDQSTRLCLCGCGLPVTSPKGVRRGHLRRVLPLIPPMVRFWKHVDYGGPGCWFWTGAGTTGGYGVFEGRSGRSDTTGMTTAHRWLYAALHGPFTEGEDCCHTCDAAYPPGDRTYRRCVRPSHLVAGTRDANMKHARESGRSARGERVSHKLTAADVTEIRLRWRNGDMQDDIADAFGIKQSSVSNIVTRKNWAHLP